MPFEQSWVRTKKTAGTKTTAWKAEVCGRREDLGWRQRLGKQRTADEEKTSDEATVERSWRLRPDCGKQRCDKDLRLKGLFQIQYTHDAAPRNARQKRNNVGPTQTKTNNYQNYRTKTTRSTRTTGTKHEQHEQHRQHGQKHGQHGQHVQREKKKRPLPLRIFVDSRVCSFVFFAFFCVFFC